MPLGFVELPKLQNLRAETLLSRARDVVSRTWFLGLALFAISWPVGSLVPEPGLDNSFAAGLHMAAHQGLRYGTQIVATYGPLGFLRYPFLYHTWTTRLALLYTGGVHLLLCVTVLWSLRRIVHLLAAFPLALLVASLVATEPESALVVVIVSCVAFMRNGMPPALERLFPMLAGIVGGLEVLIKLNTGITIAIVGAVAIVVASGRDWRPIATFIAAFVPSFLLAWFASGQGLDNIGPYIATARALISGWSTAMIITKPPHEVLVHLLCALLATLIVLAVAWRATHLDRWTVRVGATLMWIVLGFSVFKEGFLLQELGHESIYFATAVGAAIAFAGASRPGRWSVLGATVALIVLWFAITQTPVKSLIDPGPRVTALADELRTMASAPRRDRLVAEARAKMAAYYALDPQSYSTLRGQTVSVLPSEQSLVWAYRLRWQPVPVFQLYYAVTPKLDDLNARALASSSGPQRVLRNLSVPVLDRNSLFDSPEAQRSMLCHYGAISTTATYQVLARIPNRCGSPRLVESVSAHSGQWVAVPRPPTPSELVFVRVSGVAPQGLETLSTLLWRSRIRAVALRAAPGAQVAEYRLVPDTAADGLLMSVPPAADYPAPFALTSGAGQIEIGINGAKLALRYTFYAETIT